MPSSEEFEIWSSSSGVHVVDSAVRRQILQALHRAPQSLTDLVELTGKAKSTLSAIHMPELIESGLVVEKRHPDDARAVLFHLLGRPVTSSEEPGSKLGPLITQELGALRASAFLTPWWLVNPAEAGRFLTAGKLLQHLAEQVATRWAETLRETRFPGFLKELGEHLKAAGIGTIAEVSSMGHAFEVDGFRTKHETAFFRLVLLALIPEKTGLRVSIKVEKKRNLFRLRFLD